MERTEDNSREQKRAEKQTAFGGAPKQTAGTEKADSCPGSTCGGHAGLHAPGAPAGQHNRIKRPSLRLDEDANT
eukprot:1156772-Pelagomonas_calceolata.AAC.5